MRIDHGSVRRWRRPLHTDLDEGVKSQIAIGLHEPPLKLRFFMQPSTPSNAAADTWTGYVHPDSFSPAV